jgi:hypothetical protein
MTPKTPHQAVAGNVVRAVMTFALGSLAGTAVSTLFPAVSPGDGTALYVAGFLILIATVCFFLIEIGQAQGRRLESLENALNEASSQIGHVAELHADEQGDIKGVHFSHLAQVVRATKPGEQIWVLTYYRGPVLGKRITDGPYAEARREYMEALIDSARRGVEYRRILSFDHFDTRQDIRIDEVPEHTLKHCLQMLELPPATKISVKKANAVITADLFIVEHRMGAISVERYFEGDDQHTGGAIVVYDPPSTRILDQLRAWWAEASEHSAPVRRDELVAVAVSQTTVASNPEPA